MGAKSKIGWTDATWTPIRARRKDSGKVGVHCERVSEAFRNCYAATFNRRSLPVHGTGLDFTRDNREKVEMFVDEDLLPAPLRWKRPRRIFVCSQTDLFGEFVPEEMIDRVFAVMALCPQHTFQVLTKRPERMLQYATTGFGRLADEIVRFRSSRGDNGVVCPVPWLPPGAAWWPLPHVWLGVTAENQERADERIPLLLRTPAAVRFLSAEPLLGPLDLSVTPPPHGSIPINGATMADIRGCLPKWQTSPMRAKLRSGLDWVITGGESGPGARPSHPDWFRSLRDQCVAAGVPFFHKQNGEWFPAPMWNPRRPPNQQLALYPDGSFVDDDANPDIVGAQRMIRVGKAAAGRTLDGQEWSQFPEVRR